MQNQFPEGFTYDSELVFGMRKSHPGLFEIKIHNEKKKNAIATVPNKKLGELFEMANDNDEIKVILIHGGRFYSSGNDLSAFAEAFSKKIDPVEMFATADHAVNVVMVDMILAMNKCTKPIVAMVRGGAIGIGFTMLAHSTFLYCSPDAFFMTPFMKSG
jgi:enoyl-CoA hydratase/carnithine racemase